MKGQNVRMIELRRCLDLSKKTIGSERGRELGMQNLQRDEAFVLAVLRKIDGGHPATAKLAIDCVCLRQRIAQSLDRKCSCHSWFVSPVLVRVRSPLLVRSPQSAVIP